MAETVGELVYKISGDIEGLRTAVSQGEAQIKKLQGEFNNAEKSTNKASAAVGGFGKVLGFIGGLVAAGAVGNFIRSTITAATEQEIANQKLANSLSNVRGAREGDYQMLLQQADALQKVTVFADEQIIDSQALQATFQLTGEAIAGLTPRILDMASAMSGLTGGSVDLQGATIAVGKAMTSGIGVLSRYGVTFTDAQKKMFEAGDESKKLAVLTQVLDDNFKGTAETIGKTFAGRMAIAKNQLGEVKEQIGAALLPTMELLLGMFIDTTGAVQANGEKFNEWGKRIYQAALITKAVIQAIVLIIQVLAGLGDALVSIGLLGYNFAKDMVTNFKVLAGNIKQVAVAAQLAATGQFSAASDSLNTMVGGTLQNTTKSMDDFKNKQAGWSALIQEQFTKIGNTMVDAMDAKGFKPVSLAADNAYKAMGGAATKFGGESGKAAKSTKEDLQDLQKNYEDLATKGKEALEDLAEATTKELETVDEKIKDVQQSLTDLTDEFNKANQSSDTSLAEKYVGEQNAINDLKKQLSDARKGDNPNQDQISELSAEIRTREKALKDFGKNTVGLEEEIAEARRRAKLTDFQRDVEDIERDRVARAAEYEKKKAELEADLALEKKHRDDIVVLEGLKRDQINAILAQAAEQHATFEANKASATKASVDKQIEDYRRLEAAMSRTRSASTTATLPKFAVGGYVGAQGGLVHPGEYVVPAYMVNNMSGLISALEGIRSGTGSGSSRSINAPITINAPNSQGVDFRSVAEEMAWRIGRV